MARFPRVSLVAVITGLAAAAPAAAAAQTAVPPGQLPADQVWTAAGSPYVLTGDVTVPAGRSLTLEAGTVVRSETGDVQGSGEDPSRTELRVAGTLQVEGTAGAPVVFESASSSPSAGDWYGLVVLDGSDVVIAYAEVRDGQTCLHVKGDGAEMAGGRVEGCNVGVHVEGGALDIEGVTLAHHTVQGLYATQGALVTATGLLVEDNGSYGVHIDSSPVTITGSVIIDNGNYGIYARNATTSNHVTVTGNTLHANSGGLYLFRSSGTLTATVRDNVITANGSYGIRQSSASVTQSHNLVWNHSSDFFNLAAGTGTLSEDPLYVDEAGRDLRLTSRSGARLAGFDGDDLGALPFDGVATPELTGHLFEDLVLRRDDSPHLVTGDLTVRPGVTLIIEPGTEVRFAAGSDRMGGGEDTGLTELRVQGQLVADGTASLPIVFTASGTSPSPGDWYGIYLMNGSGPSVIDNAEIRFGRQGIRSQAGSGTLVQRTRITESSVDGLFVDGGSATFSALWIHDNGRYGVYVDSASPHIERTRVHDNGSHGIYVRNATVSSTVVLEGNTVVKNGGGSGIYLFRSSGSLSATVRDNLVVGNGSYGIRQSSASVTNSHNLVWDHGSDFFNLSPGTGTIFANPLLVDLDGRDLRPTSNSPARRHASDGGDIGALPYDGVPTVGLHGWLFDDVTWSAAGGPYLVLGDLTVAPGATLTVEAGAQVLVAAESDSMGSGTNVNRTEIVVLGRLVVDGAPNAPVRIESDAASPSAGDWLGIQLTASAAYSTIRNALIRHANAGVWSQAPGTASVVRSEISDSQQFGIHIDGGGLLVDGLLVHRSGSHGVYVDSASPRLDNVVSYRNGSNGIYVRNASTTNTIPINHATVWGNSGSGIYYFRSSGSLSGSVRNSVVIENGSYGIRQSSASVSLSHNNVWGHGTNYFNITAGPSSISENPQFVDTGLDNFHLLETSPNINAGDPDSAADHDAEGAPRPIDGLEVGEARPDLGAYEYNPSANKWPVANAGPSRVVTVGVSATFDGSGSYDPDGTIVSWEWDFGDGTVKNGEVVTHTYGNGGTHQVSLTVTDDDGAIGVDRIQVLANLPPVADAGPERYADPGEAITFSGGGSTDPDGTIVTHLWTFGDGNAATGAVVSHAYAAGGTYTVTLTVTDDHGATGTDTTLAHITGGDGAPPTIVHEPVGDGRPAGESVEILAEVTDPSGVASVTLFHRVEGAAEFSSTSMSVLVGSSYRASIPSGSVLAPAVEYYIEAVDGAPSANVGRHPAAAPDQVHRFTVVEGIAPAITHSPVGGPVTAGEPVTITAEVTHPEGAAVQLVYAADTEGVDRTLDMTAGSDGTFAAEIPGDHVRVPGVRYYLRATGASEPAVTVTHPAGAPTERHHIEVEADADDLDPPTIVHTPLSNGQPANTSLAVQALVSDPSGVANVWLHHRPVGGVADDWQRVALAPSGGELYVGQIPAVAVTLVGVEYYLEAVDAAPAVNVAFHPEAGADAPHAFTVTEADLAGPVILHRPVEDGRPAGQPVGVVANVVDPSGVAWVRLHFRTADGSWADGMMAPAGGDTYVAQIPAAHVQPDSVAYWIEAADDAPAANVSRLPEDGASLPFVFTVSGEADPDDPDPENGEDPNGEDDGQTGGDGGCGCATGSGATGTPVSLLVLGLGLLVLRRRRR